MAREPQPPTHDPEAPVAPDSGSTAKSCRRLRLEVSGVVQGVGFRPFVYRLATSLELSGWVLNDAAGVQIEVEGPHGAVEAFRRRLRAEAPPLSVVEACRTTELEPRGGTRFEIRLSDRAERPTALVSPDMATCDDCLAELRDPADRRHRYPFINCTNCGPRFTIVRRIPYDRPYTTMAGFEMCAPCREEYGDPLDRRFHAQPNACPDCGPAVRLSAADGTVLHGPSGAGGAEPVSRAADALREGRIVAVKGLGGFHLACLAGDAPAVERLRGRKHREDKPFAVMVADLDAARRLVELDAAETRLLSSRERPILLARRRPGAPVAEAVAPGQRDLGVMLPYSPLHHLLLADAGRPLVMTSGNVSDEPIAYRNEEALERLAPIADLFLLHDRPIHTRTDDSVVRVVTLGGERRPFVLRRSRGRVPMPLVLPEPAARPAVACGAHLKNTFAVVEGRRAWVGHHIGDLENYETLRSFEEGIAHFEALFEVAPQAVVHDLHPDYLSTQYARDRGRGEGIPRIAVQHHHAHLAACLAEHGNGGPALGVVYDGTGYGTDGTVWGGELLAGDAAGCERVGHLWMVRLPGGEAAVRRPWHMACSWLCELDAERRGDPDPPAIPAWLAPRLDAGEWRMVARLARTGLASPATTSAGRLFDAVSALCGLRLEVAYEGQAAIELEMAADGWAAAGAASETADHVAYPLPVRRNGDGPLVLDARELIRGVMSDLATGVAPPLVALRFHRGLADGTVAACVAEARRRGIGRVALSGGVFQNVLLLERVAAGLADAGFDVLVPEQLPVNDGGISWGQAAVFAAGGGVEIPSDGA